uniref:Neurotransmitter-gated ion-channel ligand-binding domain-containing protein n=1 Tax=Anopheles christyi TaxID=43041 RepID=A0A182KD69_9DIPT
MLRFRGWTWPKMGSVLLTAVFIALQFATGLANPDSKRLYDDLLSNYNRLIRPVGNNSDRLTVKMGLRLSQLIDVSPVNVERVVDNLKLDTMFHHAWVMDTAAALFRGCFKVSSSGMVHQ